MLWVFYTILAAVLWTFMDLFSKFILDKEIGDPLIAGALSGIPTFAVLILISFIFLKSMPSPSGHLVSFAAGVFYAGANLLYYSGIQKEEITRFIPTLSFTTIFTIIFAFFLVDESFSLPVYIGIFSIVLGAILISMKNKKHFQSFAGFIFAVACAMFFALRNTFLKLATNTFSLWNVTFWMGIGGLLISSIFFAGRLKKVDWKATTGEKHLIVSGFLFPFGYIAYAIAISIGPVSLASAVLKIKILLIFAGSTLISRLHPEIIHEKMGRYTLLQKLIAGFMIIAGVIVIHFLA